MCDVGLMNSNSFFYKNLLTDGKAQWSLETYQDFIDQVEHFKPFIAISSTEPLIHPHISEMVAYGTKKGLKTSVTTNGITLEHKAQSLCDAGLHELYVSIDGDGPTHNEIRRIPRIFERATAGIRKIKELYKEKGEEIKVRINYTLSNLNDDKLLVFLEAIKDLPVDAVSFGHLNYVTPEMAKNHNDNFGALVGEATEESTSIVKPELVNIDILFEQYTHIQNHKEDYPFPISFVPNLDSKEKLQKFYNDHEWTANRTMCDSPWKTLQILANGNCTLSTRCFIHKIGNIYEDSIETIWTKHFESIRQHLLKHKLFPACKRCCAVL